MRSRIALLLALLATLGVAACGESEQEKAQKDVCNARADISKQVDELKGLTLAMATVDGVRKNVNAIQDDLKQIADAQGALSNDRRAEVKAATDKFVSSITAVAQGLKSDLSLGEAKTQLQSAAQNLSAAYRDSLAKIDCDGS